MENVSPLITRQLNTRQFLVDQPNGNLYPYLPKEMITLILSHLPTFKNLCNFNETCTNLEPFRKEDGLWGILFKRCFPHLSHVVPRQNWFELCQTEYRWIRNLMKENYALQNYAIEWAKKGEKISCLTLTDNGCVVIGSEAGSIRMLDPMTGESVLLKGCSKAEKIFNLDCKGRFLLIKYKDGFNVWDLTKKQEIAIPYEERGFSKKELHGPVLSREGQLFTRFISGTASYEGYAIWIWDLEQPEKAPWGCMTDKYPAPLELCGRSIVFTHAEDSEIGFLNLDTKKHQTFLDVLASSEIYHDGFPPEIDSVNENRFFSRCARPQAQQHQPIFVWDLRDKKLAEGNRPVPCKVISLADKGKSFHVIWDAAAQPETSWTENVKKFSNAFPLSLLPVDLSPEPSLLLQEPSNAFPLCSFPELSLLFQKYIFEPKMLAVRWEDPVWTIMHPGEENLSRHSPRTAFQNGKFFCPTPDFKGILCVNFAASDQEMLEDIVKALEDERDNPIKAIYAQNRLARMPKPIQEAIDQHVQAARSEMFRRPAADVVALRALPEEAKYTGILSPLVAGIRKYLENFKK